MMEGPMVVTHGIMWILDGQKLTCPECRSSHIAWTITKELEPNIEGCAAACRCEVCGCEFTISRKEEVNNP